MKTLTATVVLALVVALLSVACGEVRENIAGPTAIPGAPDGKRLQGSPVEILD